MQGERIPLSVPTLGEPEARYLQQCIDENWVASRGRFVREFEELFARVHDTAAAVSTVSGTAALHVALSELGIGPGDEVIVPALTFIATVNPVRYVGATPVFADVDPDTYCLDAAAVEAAITKRTAAILPVHLYGHPVDMDPLLELAQRRGLAVLEDATEALGSLYKGRPCGTLSDIAAFSFNGNKVITSGGGGMLLCPREDRLEHMRHLTLQGRVPGTLEYLHDEVGFNYVLSNLQAAVGLAQLERLPELVRRRREIGARYAEGLRDAPGLRFCTEAPWADSNHWLMSVLVDPEVHGADRVAVAEHLSAAGIDTRPFFHPLPALAPYAEFARGDVPVATRLHAQGLSIPSSGSLTDADVDRVIAALLSSGAAAQPRVAAARNA